MRSSVVLPWTLCALLAAICLWGRLRPAHHDTAGYRPADTIVVRDTLRDTVPRPVLVSFDRWDTLRVPVRDTLLLTVRDTLYVPLPIERREYLTADYRAVVSGYRPRLERMEVFRQTQTVTAGTRQKRWGFGPQAGVGLPGGWYAGFGVGYHLWQW